MDHFECPFSYYARKTPGKIALIKGQKRWTYHQCHQILSTLCTHLSQAKIKEEDLVAIYPSPHPLFPLLLFALFRKKAIAIPISYYLPLKLVFQTLNEIHASHFIFPDAMNKKSLPLKQISLPFSSLLKPTLTRNASSSFLSKKAKGTYLFTSGTTSKPKIACHSLQNHFYSALGSNAKFPIGKEDRYFLSLPFYHVGGIAILFRTFLAGGALVLSDQKAFDSKMLIEEKITHLSFVPTQLHRLIFLTPDEELKKVASQLKGILIGGAPLSNCLWNLALSKKLPIYPSYGMSEMSSQIATSFDLSSSFFSLGHPLPYRELKVDEKGEILVRGKPLFLGYLNPDQKISLPLNQEGWFKTNDLGYYSTKKGLIFKGRKDRLFISGGENIYPEEIESLLLTHKNILTAHIEPLKDREFGMRPIAFIETKTPLEGQEIRNFLESFLPKYKIPIAFYPLKEKQSKTFKQDGVEYNSSIDL